MGPSTAATGQGGFDIRIDRDGTGSGRVAGELDIATAPALESVLLHALDSRAASIVLDLKRVSFIDPMGCGCWCGPRGNHVRTGIAFASTVDRGLLAG